MTDFPEAPAHLAQYRLANYFIFVSKRTITIELLSETAELLRAKAAERHLSLNEYLSVLAQAEDHEMEGTARISPQERAKRWDDWTARHSVWTQSTVDDSRDSVYSREDEAL